MFEVSSNYLKKLAYYFGDWSIHNSPCEENTGRKWHYLIFESQIHFKNDFFSISSNSILKQPMASKRCLEVSGTSNCPWKLSKPFKTILNNFLKIEFGTLGSQFCFCAVKHSENAQNKRFWGISFSKNTLNGGFLEPSLLMLETQDDNKKICRVDFRLKAYFLKKSILSVPNSQKPAKSIQM